MDHSDTDNPIVDYITIVIEVLNGDMIEASFVLDGDVGGYIKDGWIPLGGLACTDNFIAQALVLRKIQFDKLTKELAEATEGQKAKESASQSADASHEDALAQSNRPGQGSSPLEKGEKE
jgi:hypothetical protein